MTFIVSSLFSVLLSITKKNRILSIPNDGCNHSSIWTLTIKAEIYKNSRGRSKSSSHKAQNRSAGYKVLHQTLKAAALKVQVPLTLQKAKWWQGLCFLKVLCRRLSPSFGIWHIQVLFKSLSVTGAVSFSELPLLTRSLSCLSILAQCFSRFLISSLCRGCSMIQPFPHSSQFVRWMPRSVQCGGGVFIYLFFLFAFTFLHSVSHQQQMVNSAP